MYDNIRLITIFILHCGIVNVLKKDCTVVQRDPQSTV